MFRIVFCLFIFMCLFICYEYLRVPVIMPFNQGQMGLPGNRGIKGVAGKPVSQFWTRFPFIQLFTYSLYSLLKIYNKITPVGKSRKQYFLQGIRGLNGKRGSRGIPGKPVSISVTQN